MMVRALMIAATALAVPAAMAVPAAAVAQSCIGTESSVIVAAGDQFDPAISGPYVVYTDTSAGSADVYYFDRTTGAIHDVATGPGDQQLSDVNGNLVVYTSSNGGPADVFLYDIITGSTQQLTSNASDQINPAVSSRIVAYEDYSSGASNISWYDLLSGTTQSISAPGDQVSPSVSGTRIVYVDVNAGSSIVLFDTATATSTTIYGGPASSPDIDGAHVAFARSASGGNDVSVYDTTTGTTTTLALPGDQVNPHISGDFVAFEDQNSGVSHVALWNYSNGQVYYPNPSPASQALNDISGNRVVYTDNRSGNQDIYAYDFACSNSPPAVTITAPPAGSVYAVNTLVTFTGSFTDPDTLDTHTATWTFSTGSTSLTVLGTVSEASGNGTVTATVAFPSDGVYNVTLVVTDAGGLQGSANTIGGLSDYVVIYDPSAGFVTGGGWINSPEGAYAANPLVTGKATFRFFSQYKHGATTPSGQTDFQFQVASLTFHSEQYQWLVVAEARAQYKGTGTINGTGSFGFMLTAIDGDLLGAGQPDRFRIKIWDSATGNIVYDNQTGAPDGADPTTAIAAGSIRIHK